MDKQYTNNWFEERGGKTWKKILRGHEIKNALEIGCYEGQASVYLLQQFQDMKLTVIDIFDAKAAEDWDGYVDDYESRFDNNVKEFGDRLYKIKDKSFNALGRIMYYDQGGYDFIYVDGDHRPLPAMTDMCIAINLLEDNGVMIIDDYSNIEHLQKAVDSFIELLPSDKYNHYITPDGGQMVIEKLK